MKKLNFTSNLIPIFFLVLVCVYAMTARAEKPEDKTTEQPPSVTEDLTPDIIPNDTPTCNTENSHQTEEPETEIETETETEIETETDSNIKTEPDDTPSFPYYLDISLSKELQEYTYQICDENLDLYLLAIAVMRKETVRYDIDAVSKDGHDKGLMQIRDKYLDELEKKLGRKIDLLNPYDNIECGVYYLKKYMKKYNDINKALMCYNCGPGGAKKLWKNGTYSTKYSREVAGYYKEFLEELEK